MFSGLYERCFHPCLLSMDLNITKNRKHICVLLNFLFEHSKNEIGLSCEGKVYNVGSTDAMAILNGLIASKIKVKYCMHTVLHIWLKT